MCFSVKGNSYALEKWNENTPKVTKKKKPIVTLSIYPYFIVAELVIEPKTYMQLGNVKKSHKTNDHWD